MPKLPRSTSSATSSMASGTIPSRPAKPHPDRLKIMHLFPDRPLAKRSRDPDQTRRLLALAAIYDGASRTEAAQIGCVTLQIVRDWVLRFNARGPEGLRTGRAPGAPPRLTDQHRQALQVIVEQGPIPAIHGVVRWRLKDLTLWIWEEFRLSIAKQTLSRELRAMNDRKLSARPRHHAKSEAAVAAFKNT